MKHVFSVRAIAAASLHLPEFLVDRPAACHPSYAVSWNWCANWSSSTYSEYALHTDFRCSCLEAIHGRWPHHSSMARQPNNVDRTQHRWCFLQCVAHPGTLPDSCAQNAYTHATIFRNRTSVRSAWQLVGMSRIQWSNGWNEIRPPNPIEWLHSLCRFPIATTSDRVCPVGFCK